MFAISALTGRGNAQRMNRNMIVFLAADAKRYEELDEAVRKYLAWKDIADPRTGSANSTCRRSRRPRRRKRLKDADETVDLRISAAYHWLLVPVQPMPGSRYPWTRSRPTRPRTGWPSAPATSCVPPTCFALFKVRRTSGSTWTSSSPRVWSGGPHRGRQALGVLLPVRVPPPAGRALRA